MLDVPYELVEHVSWLIYARRRELNSPWRRFGCFKQALLTLAHLRKNETFAQLAAGFGVSTATAWRYVEAGRQGGQRLVLPQVHQYEQGLAQVAELPPPRTAFTPSCVEQPGNVLDQLMRDLACGAVRDQARLLGRCVVRRERHRSDQEPRLVTYPR